MNFYQEKLLDHYRSPRNRGSIDKPDFTCTINNFSCGDTVTVTGKIVGNILIDIKFSGAGCVISQATASILSEKISNMALQDIKSIDKDYILKLIEIPVGPTRLRCALLCIEAVHEGINSLSIS